MSRHVGAQAQAREQIERALDLAEQHRCAGRRKPADAVAAGALHLRQAVESEAGYVARKPRKRQEFGAVVNDLVVDFVGQDHQAVARGDIDDRLEYRARIHRAGRIVRVDDHDRARALRDRSLDLGLRTLVDLLAQLAEQRLGHAGAGDRRDGVDLDVVLRPFRGQHPGEADQSHLGRAVVGLAEVAEHAGVGRGVDDPAAHLDGAFGRPHDSRQDLEQGALARAVGPDDPQRLAMGDAQRDVPECPEPDRRPAQHDVRDGLPDGPFSAEAQVVLDAQVLSEDRGMRLRSVRRARDDGRRHP